jgi:serine/threonine protein phosphatase 1
MREFVIGDIHGGYKALKQCLELSRFNYKKDKLICLGDITDGWPETPQCIEELLKIKNLVYVIGNHDDWLWDWFNTGSRPIIWTEQGGQATLDAYLSEAKDANSKSRVPLMVKHREFFKKGHYYYLDEDNRLFVHGGINPAKKITEQSPQYMTWDRAIYDTAVAHPQGLILDDYKEVYIGHTTTSRITIDEPLHRGNIWCCDQGGGFEGRLTLMDINTKEFWQSDIVKFLYPLFRGR